MNRLLLSAAGLLLVLAACVPAAGTVNPQQLAGQWTLLNIQYADGTVSAPEFGEFTVDFDFSEERAFVVADCNRGSGAFEATEAGVLTFGPIAQTMMACPPGSMGTEFAMQLNMANRYAFIDSFLHLSNQDGTSLVFQR